jgi:hypothetical protein
MTLQRNLKSAEWRTDPASSPNLKPPPLGGGVFTRCCLSSRQDAMAVEESSGVKRQLENSCAGAREPGPIQIFESAPPGPFGDNTFTALLDWTTNEKATKPPARRLVKLLP